MKLQRCALVGALALSAHAASAADQGFYFGLLAGQAKYDIQSPPPVVAFGAPGASATPIFNERLVLGTPPRAICCEAGFVVSNPIVFSPLFWSPADDDKDTAWGALVGYRAARYVAVELSYLNLGTLKASQTVQLPPILGGGTNTYRRELETTGPALSVLGILPVTEQWEVYLRAGVLFADMELSSSIAGPFGSASGSTTFGSQDPSWGVGTQYNWGDHWTVRLDFQRFEGVGSDSPNEADIDLMSVGVVYRL